MDDFGTELKNRGKSAGYRLISYVKIKDNALHLNQYF